MIKFLKKYNSLDDLNILKAIVTLLFFVFLAKIIALFKEVVIASQFGISPQLDAYNFIFSFVQWPVALYGSVVISTLIPLISKIRTQKLDNEIIQFRSELLGVTIVLSLVILVLFYFIFDWLLLVNVFNLDSFQIKYAQHYLPFLVWIIPLGFLTMLFSAWTMSSKRHINTILEAIPALTIIGTIFILDSDISIVYGLILGFFVQVIILLYYLLLHKEIEWPKTQLKSENWLPLIKGLSYMIIAQFFMSLIPLVDQYFAAGLGIGVVSIFSFSERILAIVLSLGVVVIGRAILPIFSDLYNKGIALNRIVIKWTLLMFIVGVLATLIFYLFAEDIVRIIFERGTFNKLDTIQVSKLLQVASLQIPFYIGGMVISYAIISLRLYKIFVLLNGILLVIKIISIYILINYGFEISSLPISAVIVYVFSFFLCLSYFFWYCK